MKKIFKLTGAAVAAALAASMVFSSFADTAASPDFSMGVPETVMMDGTVITVEEGRLFMNRNLGGQSEEIIVTISDDTKVLDGVNGYPIPLENLGTGEAVRVYAGPAMTMSLPAITNGIVVIADVPADAAFPVYTTVKSLVQNPVTADGNGGDYVLTTTDGNSYKINSSTTLLPYLTRNIVREADLTPGTPILMWLWTADGSAPFPEKIVVFQGENGYGSNPEDAKIQDGWKQIDDNWYFYENGQVKKGWLYEGSDWYYLNPQNGCMETGFVMVDGRTYFLKEDGRMLTEATVFVPDENGALHIKK